MTTHPINQRAEGEPGRRRTTLLLEYPDEKLEAIVLQWENQAPTVLIQLKANPIEPIQFAGDPPEARSAALEAPLLDFIDPARALIFGKRAHLGDILLSARAFTALQPEPDLVLSAEALGECRTEALRATRVADKRGIELLPVDENRA